MTRYPLASPGIFRTIQGEGVLLGVPMTFVRLAGCSIGCHECDTNYRVQDRLTAQQIRQRVDQVRGSADWIWVTGGEPADHELRSLLEELRLSGRVAIATSGARSLRGAGSLIDFLSVSPHGKPEELQLRGGSQLNLVSGLNGLRLADWERFETRWFEACWVTPMFGSAESLAECLSFLERHNQFRLGVQAHK